MANEGMLRVGCLYRVSTKVQVEKDDIPMQKTACRDFINRQDNWRLVKEYAEKGVSGYKKSAVQRDVLQQVRHDAEKKLFDILLVFMFDRLGRKEDETPFIVEWFHKKGIRIWSVKEGEQRFDSRVDKLLNYIRYWQSGGESEKTGIRVNEKHIQMIKQGLYRGGVAPYGYKLVKSGVQNKKGKELLKLAIDEEESRVVKLVYELAFEHGYGGYRIAKHLNREGIKPRKGKDWGLAVINYMLRNPIYKGYMNYGKTTYKGEAQGRVSPSEWVLAEKPSAELVIIPEDLWDKVQVVRKIRTPEIYRDENMDYGNYPMQTKSPLLLVGWTKCGHCGAALTTSYHKSAWTTKAGEHKEVSKPVYRCSGRATGKVTCSGPLTYSKDRIETAVLNEVYRYLNQLRDIDMTDQIERIKARNMAEEQKELIDVRKRIRDGSEELSILHGEVAKSISGRSDFKPELLSRLIEGKETELGKLRERKIKLEDILESKKVEVRDMLKFQKMIPSWKEEFEKAELEKKKMMLSQIVEEITVRKESLKIKLKLYIDDFTGRSGNAREFKNGKKLMMTSLLEGKI